MRRSNIRAASGNGYKYMILHRFFLSRNYAGSYYYIQRAPPKQTTFPACIFRAPFRYSHRGLFFRRILAKGIIKKCRI